MMAVLIEALRPLTSRVRVDVTAVRKASGVAWTQAPLTDEMLAQHLDSGPLRGCCPIKAGESTTRIGLLDFDSHKGEVSWQQMSEVVAGVVDTLEVAYGLAPVLFRSSGGNGVHLVCLWDEPQDAYSVRELLREVLVSCGLRDGAAGVRERQVEVFPRQDSVAIGKMGNMFILPLGNKSVPLALGDEEPDLW